MINKKCDLLLRPNRKANLGNCEVDYIKVDTLTPTVEGSVLPTATSPQHSSCVNQDKEFPFRKLKEPGEVNYRYYSNFHYVSIDVSTTNSGPNPDTWDPGLPYRLKSSEQRYAEDRTRLTGATLRNEEDNHGSGANVEEQRPSTGRHTASDEEKRREDEEDPDRIIKRDEDEELEQFMNDNDTPAARTTRTPC